MMEQRKELMTQGTLKLSHGGPSQSQASGINQWIKALLQDRH